MDMLSRVEKLRDKMEMSDIFVKIALDMLTACYPAHLMDWLHKLNPVGRVEGGSVLLGSILGILVDLAMIGKYLLNIITPQVHRISDERGSASI